MSSNRSTGPPHVIYKSSYNPLRTSEDSESSIDALQNPTFISEGSAGNEPSSASSQCAPPWRSYLSPADALARAPFIQNNVGLLLVAFSQLFFALMHTSVKILNTLDPPISALELVVVRMAVTYICCIGYMLWKRIPDPLLGPSGVRLLLVFRGFAGFFRVFGVYYSLQFLSLSDATVLTFLSPLSTAFAGHIFLDEGFSRKEAAAGVLSLIGVVFIARPQSLFGDLANGQIAQRSLSTNGPTANIIAPIDNTGDEAQSQRLLAVGAGLLGVAGATCVYTSIRAIGKRAHPLHSLSFFSSHCIFAGLIGMLIVQEPFIFPFHVTWISLFLLVTVFGFLAQVFLTMGLQREAAGRGTLALYVQIIFASILEQILFHTVPTVLSVAGTIIILISAIYVALTKRATQLQYRETGDEESRGAGYPDSEAVDTIQVPADALRDPRGARELTEFELELDLDANSDRAGRLQQSSIEGDARTREYHCQ